MNKNSFPQKTTRLKSVIIKKLFNLFDYTFDYENWCNLSIVIAPNGCGKTTIFKLISFILCPTSELLQTVISVPFESFECIFSNGNIAGLEKKVDKTKKEKYTSINGNIEEKKCNYYEITFYEKFLSEEKREFKFFSSLKAMLPRDILRFNYHEDDLAYDGFEYDKKGHPLYGIPEIYVNAVGNLSREEWIASFYTGSGVRVSGYRFNWRPVLSALRSARSFEYPRLCFINANRLERFIGEMSADYVEYREDGYYREGTPLRGMGQKISSEDTLARIQNKLKNYIQKGMREYDKLVADAKNKLPKNYLGHNSADNRPKKEFLQEWDKYFKELEKYADIGLISSDIKDLKLDNLETAYQSKADFLQVYLEEYQKTLKPLECIYPKLQKFASIINKRNNVTHKTLKFDRYGMSVEFNGEKIPLNALSSGEKNDLIMFYSLIFDASQGSLILIDEPEISLHIEWQEEYIDRLLELCESNDLQIIIATHSPYIVNDHIDLYAQRMMEYADK